MKKPTKRSTARPAVRPIPLDALHESGDSIAYHAPLEPPQISIYEHQPILMDDAQPATLGVVPGVIDGVNWPPDWHEGEEGWPGKGGQGTGGRSEKVLPPPKETAKPLSPLPDPLSTSLSTHSSNESVTDTQNPDVSPVQDMPVLGDLRGVHRKEGGKVVESCHTGGVHSKNGPVLGHKGSTEVITSLNVPYSPDVEEPLSTEEVAVASPFVTGNERIDRRTAFTQFCRLGEGRTYVKVAEIMGVSLETIRGWAKEDTWENAYRERVTADIVQVAKEENIHEVLDIRREVIAQLKKKIAESREGKEVFKSTKEMLDTMLKLEELTGASTASSVKPGQIFVIIDKDEWEAREKMNEQARKEEVGA